MSKKCNNPGEFPALVVFLGVFFEKLSKTCNSPGRNNPGVTTVTDAQNGTPYI